jgi:hypothetical protein
MVSDAGGKKGFVYRNRQDVYKALIREGKPKAVAAAIANGGHTAAGRKKMARKAAMTRKKIR